MAKFKVGEEVVVKHSKDNEMTFVVIQIEEITCSAGTQVYYEGRIWQKDHYEKGKLCLTRLVRLNEIELEKKGG